MVDPHGESLLDAVSVAYEDGADGNMMGQRVENSMRSRKRKFCGRTREIEMKRMVVRHCFGFFVLW